MAMTFEMNNVRRDSDITLTNEIKHSSDRKSTRLNSSHIEESRMPSSA